MKFVEKIAFAAISILGAAGGFGVDNPAAIGLSMLSLSVVLLRWASEIWNPTYPELTAVKGRIVNLVTFSGILFITAVVSKGLGVSKPSQFISSLVIIGLICSYYVITNELLWLGWHLNESHTTMMRTSG